MSRPAADDGAGHETATRAALARYYDLDLDDDPGDINLYLAMASATDGPLLELMAGSGRLALPLAEAGNEVVAVDNDAHMLARAAKRWTPPPGRAHHGSLELVEADVRDVDLGRVFGLVIVALNSILVLPGRRAQADLLATVARHLAPGGRAVIDTWLPAPDDLVLYDGRLVLDWVRRDTETGEWVAKTTSARLSAAARTARITSFFDAWRDGDEVRRVMRQDTVSLLAADELVALAEAAGLLVETLADDHEMGDFTADSDRLVMVCRRITG